MAYRLVRMFSFHGDTVADPFAGTGTTWLTAMRTLSRWTGVSCPRPSA
jgi:DNA modification methylase